MSQAQNFLTIPLELLAVVFLLLTLLTLLLAPQVNFFFELAKTAQIQFQIAILVSIMRIQNTK